MEKKIDSFEGETTAAGQLKKFFRYFGDSNETKMRRWFKTIKKYDSELIKRAFDTHIETSLEPAMPSLGQISKILFENKDKLLQQNKTPEEIKKNLSKYSKPQTASLSPERREKLLTEFSQDAYAVR